MKTSLSSLDLMHLSKELDGLLRDSYIEKVYQLEKKKFKFKIRHRSLGNLSLILSLPNFIFLSSYDWKSPEKPSALAMRLRKLLKGCKIKKVEQHDFERILIFELEKKEERLKLIAELFSKGNLFLLDESMKIIALLERQEWKHRKLKLNEKYEFPPESFSPSKGYDAFKERLRSQKKRKVVVALAKDLNFGGILAEEICMRSGIDKSRSVDELSLDEVQSLYSVLLEILSLPTNPRIILSNENEAIDVVPIAFKIYEGKKSKSFENFNSALDEFFSKKELAMVEKEKLETLEKLLERKKIQENLIKEYESKLKDLKLKADFIYQHLHEIDALLSEIREMRKSSSLSEVKEKFVGKKLYGFKILSLDESGEIEIEYEKSS